jgi:hypothetical protein
MWWGGWLLFNYPGRYEFDDFLISNFALLFSLFGLAAAFQDMSDRKEMEKSASRIFFLLDRKSSIDPLGSSGKILNTNVLSKKKTKSSVKKKSMKSMEPSDKSDTEATDDGPISQTKKKPSKKKSSSKIDVDVRSEADPVPPKKPKSMKKKKSQKKRKENDTQEE